MREAGVKEKGALKTARLTFFPRQKLAKPDWIRVPCNSCPVSMIFSTLSYVNTLYLT